MIKFFKLLMTSRKRSFNTISELRVKILRYRRSEKEQQYMVDKMFGARQKAEDHLVYLNTLKENQNLRDEIKEYKLQLLEISERKDTLEKINKLSDNKYKEK